MSIEAERISRYSTPPASSCTGKQRFEASGDARKTVRHLERRNAGGRDVLKVYPCAHCSGWHIGKTHKGRLS